MFELFKAAAEKKYPGTTVAGQTGKKTPKGALEIQILTRKGTQIQIHSKLYGDGDIQQSNLPAIFELIEEKLHYYIYRREEYKEENIYARADGEYFGKDKFDESKKEDW